MKITKTDLKQIVKECLVEILSEGIGSPVQAKKIPVPAAPINTESFARSNQQRQPQAPKKNNLNPALKTVIHHESGGNKIMESILADTASSTLPKMLQNDRPAPPVRHPGGIAEQVVAATDPSDLFGGEVASRWANLAFMESPIKK